MAMTATLAASPTTVQAGPDGVGTANVTLTVSNSAAGTTVEVVGLRPFVSKSGAVTQQSDPVSIGQPTLVQSNQGIPPAGTGTFSFKVGFYAPQVAGVAGGAFGPASLAYDIGCEVTCADGTVIYATVVTITVNPSPHS